MGFGRRRRIPQRSLTAQGMSDAFRSAEWLAQAIHDGFSGIRPLNEALADYHRKRDEHLTPMYEMTCGLATSSAPPPEIQALYAALIHNQPDTDRLMGIFAGTYMRPEY